jgi:hypothetical protein
VHELAAPGEEIPRDEGQRPIAGDNRDNARGAEGSTAA